MRDVRAGTSVKSARAGDSYAYGSLMVVGTGRSQQSVGMTRSL